MDSRERLMDPEGVSPVVHFFPSGKFSVVGRAVFANPCVYMEGVPPTERWMRKCEKVMENDEWRSNGLPRAADGP